MDPLALAIGLVLLGAALALVLKPLRARPHLALSVADARRSAGEARAAALSALRDLDFDFQTGKLSEDDYPALRAGLLEKAAEHMQAEEAEDDQIEALIRARRASPAHSKPCPKCGRHIGADVHFCPNCGTPLGSACLSCGGVIRAGDSFCSACGVKVDGQDRVVA